MSLNLLEVTREDGVKDLPNLVKVKFAHALVEERKGNYAEAASYLNDALDAEKTAA